MFLGRSLDQNEPFQKDPPVLRGGLQTLSLAHGRYEESNQICPLRARKLYGEGYEYKKALVKFSGIRDQSSTQLSFLEKWDTEKDLSLMKTMDRINQKEGPMTLRVASCRVYDKAWKMKQSRKSPRYLTGWCELPSVA